MENNNTSKRKAEDWLKKGSVRTGDSEAQGFKKNFASQGASRGSFGNLKARETEGKTDKAGREDNKAMKIVDWIIRLSIYLTVFLLPLFFWANVPSPLELNKQTILVGLIGIGFLAWIGKMAWKNEMKFRKSFALIPVVTFLLIYGLSTFFSGYFEQSMWGYFGGESKSFVTLLFLVALFILIFNNIKRSSDAFKLVLVFLVGGFLTSLYGFLQLLGIHILPMEGVAAKTFNTVGSVYIFGVFVASLLIISITLFLSNLQKMMKIGLIVLSFFFFVVLMAINFNLVWIALMVILAVILGITIIMQGEEQNQGRILPMIFLVLTLMMILRSQPVFKVSDMPIEVSLNYKTSATIASESIKQNPMLGSGPTTFTNVYKINRPEKLGDFSAVNFSESTSYFFTLVSTVGILGALSFLFLTGTGLALLFKGVIRVISKKSQEGVSMKDHLLIASGMVWLYSTIVLFFYFANITILTMWWFSLALYLSVYYLKTRTDEGEVVATSKNPKSSFALSFVFVLVIIGFITAIYLHGQKYVAAAQFQDALRASNNNENPEEIARKVASAVELDPNRDIYYRNLAMAHLASARQKITEKGLQNLTPEESNTVSSRFRKALQALNQAKALDKNDSLNFVSIANLYKEFIPIQEEAGEKALENYRKAIELDPKNPDLYQGIASVYVTLSDMAQQKQAQQQAQAGGQAQEVELPQKSKEHLNMAEENLKAATSIKPSHPGANLMLVTVYQRMKDTDRAIAKAEENIKKFPNTPELYFNLGLIHYNQEDYENAKNQLLEAVNMNEKYSNARYFLGLAYSELGNNQQALSQFRKVQELNQDNEQVGKIIENLENGNDPLEGLQQQQNQAQQQPEPTTPTPQEELPAGSEAITPGVGEETEAPEQPGEEPQPAEEENEENPEEDNTEETQEEEITEEETVDNTEEE
ncbi:MAG: tetratricopeptide repeat protein [Candidatus Moranbacteria bacterium]|nr:tetratricopeptide repeat protein [Candidatus Moranbacteria bacterium]